MTLAQQNTFTSTTLSAAITSSTKVISLASVSGINGQGTVPGNATDLYIDRELLQVVQVNTVNNTATVIRGIGGTQAAGHISGSTVLAGQPSWFNNYSPEGSCTLAQTLVSPWINTREGTQWLCSSVLGAWIPGFGNPGVSGTPLQVGAAVASAATITPSAPVFHVTGTTSIVTISLPTGFNGGQIYIIFDGVAAWTAAGNIAVAGTPTTAGSMVYFTYDRNTGKWYPSRMS
jgi:hypothetical protein